MSMKNPTHRLIKRFYNPNTKKYLKKKQEVIAVGSYLTMDALKSIFLVAQSQQDWGPHSQVTYGQTGYLKIEFYVWEVIR